jgi:type I restriction enzyme S subunit
MSVEGWKTKALGSVAEIIMGQSPDSRYYSEEEIGLPFLQGCAEFTSKFPSAVLFCSQVKKIARTGSILFSVRAPVGRTNLTDTDYIIGRGLAALIASQISQDYLHHYLVYSESGFRNNSQGSTFEAINSKELRDWAISFPEFLQEQTQIATILSTIDRAIEQTEALIAKQQRIKTGLMQDLLTKGIDENGNIRSEETHEFKDSPLGRIPVEWEVKSLDELTTKIGDGIHTTPAYSENTGFFFINGNNLGDGSIHITSDTLCVNQGEFRKYYIELDDRTILYSINGTIGNIAFYKNEPVVLGKSAAYIKCKKSVNARLIYHILQSEPVHRFYDYELTGSTIKNLSLAAMRATPIKIPRMQEEQEFLACRLDLCVYEIGQANNCLSKLRSLKTGLMQDLLTGKVRVTELIKERETDNL